jgi:hypothetical protein
VSFGDFIEKRKMERKRRNEKVFWVENLSFKILNGCGG